MATTLLLDTLAWDLTVDAAGNIAVASEPYSQAQDAASACKVFLGECYYNTTIGIPYFQDVLGHLPPAQLFKSLMVAEALTVPGVVSAACFLTSFNERELKGQIQVTNNAGITLGAAF